MINIVLTRKNSNDYGTIKAIIQYSGQAYNETSTINEANFWAAKVAPDGSLTEVPNSRYSTTIEANRKIAKNIQSKSISVPIQQGESV